MNEYQQTRLSSCCRRLLIQLLDGINVALRTDKAARLMQRPVYLVVVSTDGLTATSPRAFRAGTVR